MIEAAERYGTTIAFEPVNHLQAGFHLSLADVMALAARLSSPRFKPMLDTFHMNIEEKFMVEPIHRAGRDLADFHLYANRTGVSTAAATSTSKPFSLPLITQAMQATFR